MIRRVILAVCMIAASSLLACGVCSLERDWEWRFGSREPLSPDKPWDPIKSGGPLLRASIEGGFVLVECSPRLVKMPSGWSPGPGHTSTYGPLSWGRNQNGIGMPPSGHWTALDDMWLPHRDMWSVDYYWAETSCYIPLLLLVAFPVYALGSWLRRGRRRCERGACLRCGYDLRGNVTRICSECGTKTHTGPGVPTVIRVRRGLLAGCAAAALLTLALTLLSLVRPLTVRQIGPIPWRKAVFEPRDSVFAGDELLEVRWRMAGGWLLIERRWSHLGAPSPDWPAEWRPHGHGGMSDAARQIWFTPDSRTIENAVLSYRAYSRTGPYGGRAQDIWKLSMWAIVGLLGFYPAVAPIGRWRGILPLSFWRSHR